jgi:hypothetical protein
LLLAAMSLALLAGGVAWAVNGLSAKDIAINAGVGCYDRPSLDGNITIFVAAADPVAKCERFWRQGVVDAKRGPASPHLVACTGENSAIAVFPGPDSTCERLGMELLPADYPPAGRAHARAYRALFLIGERMPGLDSECTSPRYAAAVARHRLAKTHFPFPVEVEIMGDLPCAREYRISGGKVVVRTSARANATEARQVTRIDDAIDGLVKAVARDCMGKAAFLKEADRDLARAGLSQVTVKVVGNQPCVNAAFSSDGAKLEFFTREPTP